MDCRLLFSNDSDESNENDDSDGEPLLLFKCIPPQLRVSEISRGGHFCGILATGMEWCFFFLGIHFFFAGQK